MKVERCGLAVLTVSVLLSAVGRSEAAVTSVTLSSPTKPGEVPSLVLHEGIADDWVARSNYSDEISTSGWAYLELETNPDYTDQEQAYAAGYAEGAASHELIYNHYRNVLENYCKEAGEDYCSHLKTYLKQNREWMKKEIEAHADTVPRWHQVDLILLQIQGVGDGYRNTSSKHLSDEDIFMLNLGGDLGDLEAALKYNATGEVLRVPGHCSALVKPLQDNSELYTAHVTWSSLQTMLRVQKMYIFPFKIQKTSDMTVPSRQISFPSYPGCVHSIDDFYLLSSGLVTMETTIGNNNPDLWVFTTPDTLFEFIRVVVANRLAEDGPSWAHIFEEYNSGTYNNEWMIVDYKLFTPHQTIKDDTLWVVEQIPGLVVAEDQSSYLRDQGYWPSYNSPFYPKVFNLSGSQELVDQYGDWFTYDKTPRALIFARDQGSVVDIDSMVKLMRYNDYQNDPLSACDCDPPYSAENAISCRDDLNPLNGTYEFEELGPRLNAGIDMKLTSAEMFNDFEYLAVSSPTYDQQPVFQWSTSIFADNTPHYGHPDVWNFPLVQVKWNW